MLAQLLEQYQLSLTLPRIAFAHPEWLFLIPVLIVLAWFIARHGLSGWNDARRLTHLIIRCLVIILLCGALAQPEIRWRADDVAVTAVLDISDSVPPEQKRLATEFLNGSLAKRRPSDRFGLVTVARDAIVQSLPSREARTDAGWTGATNATDLQQGIELAQALTPADAAGRVLVLTDGNETSGSLAASATGLLAKGVPIDVAMVEYDRSDAVHVEDVILPTWVRDGEIVNARVVLRAGAPTSGRLSLTLNGQPLDLDPDTGAFSAPMDLSPGVNTFSQAIRLPSGPVHRIEAIFDPEGSKPVVRELLRAEGVVFTSSRGRVLVLTESETDSAPFVQAISSPDQQVDVRTAAQAPVDLTAWAGYDAVVLFNQPASNFAVAQQEQLIRYVSDLGGGVLFTGGPDSFGAGGWIGAPLADIAPVMMDPPMKRNMPMGALALIIDCSGSMGMLVAGTGMTQQDIACEAAILGINALSRQDQVAVISFSGSSEVVVPLTPCTDPDRIARQIRSIGSGGGTNLFPALDAAAAELAKSPAGVRHIIVLTDGATSGDPADGIARAANLKARGITLSTVRIGDSSNDTLLQQLALAGGGRRYNVASQNSKALLPQIIIKEAQTVRRTLIWEGAGVAPTFASSSDSLRGISPPFPKLTGYIVTGEREGLVSTVLRGPENDPILAQWQFGVGRVTAYTSDPGNRWNAQWASWPLYHSFWQQQLKWVMRPSGDALSRVSVDTSGRQAKVSLELFDPAGERVNFAHIRARAASADNPRHAGRDVTFRQVSPGRYEAMVESSEFGLHLLSIRYETPGEEGDTSRRSGSIQAAIVRRADAEMRQPTPNATLLNEVARRTGGRVYRLDTFGTNLWAREHLKMPETARSIWLLVTIGAIGLFIVDVAARRVAVDLNRVHAAVVGLFVAPPRAAPRSMERLAAAKARAAEEQQKHAERKSPARPNTSAASPVATPTPPQPAASRVPARQPVLPPDVESKPDAQPTDLMARLHAAKRRSRRDGDDAKS